jgi:hypothetical protein
LSPCAPQKGIEQGGATASTTGDFGEVQRTSETNEVRRTPEAIIEEKPSKPGIIDSTENFQPALDDTARVKAIRRDPAYRPIKPQL